MAPTSSKMTNISPYYFGLNGFFLCFTLPVFYFLSKTLEGIFFPPQPFAPLQASKSNLLKTVSPNTYSHSEPQEISIYNDYRCGNETEPAVLACFLATFLYVIAYYSETKWNGCSAKASWSYKLYGLKHHSNWPQERRDELPDMIPSHHDYRISQRREATKLLFLVAMSACLCPIAEFLLGARRAVAEQLYRQESAVGWTGLLWRGLFAIYLVFRYGTLPCWLTAIASAGLTAKLFEDTAEQHDSKTGVRFWDTWIERWNKAHQMENGAAVAKWMAEEYLIYETEDGGLEFRSAETGLISHVLRFSCLE